ncbi:gp53-like domain-containing protein [Serratia marcescens]|uniref:gp53-like domain-containing protein n=1 Tax=Serratia marcescens TaxID=615 RepID=UPI003EDA271A
MAKNEFLPFGTAANANVLPNADYQGLPARSAGFGSGVAKSEELNTVWRQGSTMAAVLGQFIADKTGQDVLDDGDLPLLNSNFKNALDKNTLEGFESSLQPRGYQKLPSGLIIQWGTEYTDNTSVNIKFPIEYSNAAFYVSPVKITAGDGRFSTVGEVNKIGFNAYGRLGVDAAVLNNFMWFSVGF